MLWNSRRALAVLTVFALIALALSLLADANKAWSQPPSPTLETIACRALEVHTGREPGITVAIFHPRDASDRARLGSLLRAHSSESAQFQTAEGKWHGATVLRLKSCFGRGVLLFPAGTAELAEKAEFVLQFASRSPSETPTSSPQSTLAQRTAFSAARMPPSG